MNIAILTAGGTGARMNNSIPKQFLTVNNKPIIIYTLEAFERHPNIDAIVVPCLIGWEKILAAYATQFKITKLKCIISGGGTGQESVFAALQTIKDFASDDDIVMIHDGNRPLVSDMVISDSLAVCTAKGNAVAQIPVVEVLVVTDDSETSHELLSRDRVKRTQTPHTFRFGQLYEGYTEMIRQGKTAQAACDLMITLGKTIHFSIGSEDNFKITTETDLRMFEALISARSAQG